MGRLAADETIMPNYLAQMNLFTFLSWLSWSAYPNWVICQKRARNSSSNSWDSLVQYQYSKCRIPGNGWSMAPCFVVALMWFRRRCACVDLPLLNLVTSKMIQMSCNIPVHAFENDQSASTWVFYLIEFWDYCSFHDRRKDISWIIGFCDLFSDL